MVEEKLKWSIDAAIPVLDPKSFVKKFETLVEKIGPQHQEDILRLVTDSYLLAVEDCRRHWKHYAGPVYKPGLKKLYDTIEPDHEYVFN